MAIAGRLVAGLVALLLGMAPGFAMKGLSWTSPRGPVSIDPATREVIQNIYICKVERTGGQLYNVEFATVPSVKDPSKVKN